MPPDPTPAAKIASTLTPAERRRLNAYFASIGGPDWRLVRFYDGRQILAHKDYRPELWLEGQPQPPR